MEKSELLAIGKITGAHGIRGAVKIYPFAETEAFFESGRKLLVRRPRAGVKTYRICRIRPHKHLLLADLEGVGDCTAAEGLAGAEILVQRRELPGLDDGTYYWHDLYGLSVYTPQNQHLGTIEDIIATGSNDVYVVRNRRREVLVPALATVVLDVDIAAGTMCVDLPEGL